MLKTAPFEVHDLDLSSSKSRHRQLHGKKFIFTGIALTALTGILWMFVGIVYSQITGKRLNFTAFMLVYSLAYGIFVCANIYIVKYFY